ncbi:Uncharacterised protein [Mycobacterium tuberculosis]|nr:Uncharacterised protein [Mycobacterium tuberculosis]
MRMALVMAVSPSDGTISLAPASPSPSSDRMRDESPATAAAPSASRAASFSGDRLAL